MTVQPGRFYFAANDLEWVNRKWDTIRHAQHEADKAIKKWRRINEEVISYLDRSGVEDMMERANIKSQNLTLADALSTGTWWRNEARAHMADLTLYLRLKELGML